MFIGRLSSVFKGRTITPTDHPRSQDRTPDSVSRYPHQNLRVQNRNDSMMGQCPSVPSFLFGRSNSRRPTQNDCVPIVSTEVLIPEHAQSEPTTKDLAAKNSQVGTSQETKDSNPDLEKEIRSGLRGLMKKSSDRDNSNIILEQDLINFWTTAKCKFYTRQSWYDLEWDERDEMKKFMKIISILILARFEDWSNFRQIFFDHKERSDGNLLFKLEDLKDDNFLGSDFAQDFYNYQWILCPLVIEERQEPYELLGMEAERRFPYIKPGEEIGSGATGTVCKQVIAARHLKYFAQGRKSDNAENKTIACKSVIERSVEMVEFENLRSLRECLSHHSRIMVNIATIIQHSPDSGKVYLILYDLASYDLNTLLNRGPGDHTEEHQRRHDTAPQKRNGSHDWWAGDLIKESQNLADALDFLHHRLYSDRNWTLVHNDLKPENILVFYPDSSRTNEKYPVGQWKIADFGLAKIKEKQESKPLEIDKTSRSNNSPRPSMISTEKLDVDVTHRRTRSASIREISFTAAKRDTGRYTAPEVEEEGKRQNNPKGGDIWAFGCIFSEVLAYAIAPPLVAELRRECGGPEGLDQRFYDVNTKKAKETVMTWLEDLPKRYQVHPVTPVQGQTVTTPSWVTDCVRLIERTLAVNPKDRCSAGTIRNELGRIVKKMSRQDKFTLIERIGSTNGFSAAKDYQAGMTVWVSEHSGSPKSIKASKVPHIGEVIEHNDD